MAIRLHSSGTLPWVLEAFHMRFLVSSIQGDLHEKQGFSHRFAARVKDSKARPHSFFLFCGSCLWPNNVGKTSGTQGNGTFARMLILCKPLAFIGKTLKTYLKNSLNRASDISRGRGAANFN